MSEINLKELEGLSPEQKELALKMLSEYSETGQSETFKEVLYEDYIELPVDIDTFINDPLYLGKAWTDGNGKCKMYPFWQDVLHKLFPDPFTTSVNNLIESGARGLGKSEIGITVGLYLLHRILCLRNPNEYFGLKPTEKIAFAFMNITKTLAEEIGIAKFQATVQLSPWFMERGTLTGRGNIMWNPPDNIHIIVGSQSSHVIGQPIYFCLDGDTSILTTKGEYKLKDLVDVDFQVYSIDSDKNIAISEHCTAKCTTTSLEEYQIELEDGTILKCTPNHKFMLKDGTYKEAQYLTEDDELFDTCNKKYLGYIYKFTLIPTGKIYIGKREKSKFDNSYYGSGKIWTEEIKKFQLSAIKREVIDWGYTRAELREKEKYWIDFYNSRDPEIGYNIHEGGAGGNSLGNTQAWSELHSGPKNGRYHKPVSQETRNKISKANKGKVRTAEFKQKVSAQQKGKPKPPDFGEKVSKAQCGRKRTEIELLHVRQGNLITAEKNKGKHIYNNGQVEKRFYTTDIIPEGFIKGRLPNIVKNINNLPKNYHWYHDDNSEIYIDKQPDNFVPGRLKKK